MRLAIEARWADAVRSVVQAVASPDSEMAHGDEASEALAEVARMAAEANDLAAADEALIAALLIRPQDSDRLHQRAAVRHALGDRPEARALLERALAVDPSHVGARLELSMLETRDGRLGNAVAALRALDHRAPPHEDIAADDRSDPFEPPSDLDAGIARVRRERGAGRRDAAARRVDGLLEAHPAHPELHTLRAEIEFDSGALDDAVASCAAALELQPDGVPARVLFAKALEGLGLRDQALEQIGFALGREPEHQEALALEARWSAGRKRSAARENRGSHRS